MGQSKQVLFTYGIKSFKGLKSYVYLDCSQKLGDVFRNICTST